MKKYPKQAVSYSKIKIDEDDALEEPNAENVILGFSADEGLE